MTEEELLEKLISFKIISAEDLKRGKNEAAKRRTPLLQTLFSLGIIEKEDVYEIEAEDMGTVYVQNSDDYNYDLAASYWELGKSEALDAKEALTEVKEDLLSLKDQAPNDLLNTDIDYQ